MFTNVLVGTRYGIDQIIKQKTEKSFVGNALHVLPKTFILLTLATNLTMQGKLRYEM